MERFSAIALTHKSIPLELIGRFHIEDEQLSPILNDLKTLFDLSECMYLSTCNRVEILMVKEGGFKKSQMQSLLKTLQPNLNSDELQICTDNAEYHSNEDALKHLLRVSSSLDSMVIGEREIITQVRNAYNKCCELGLTGDLLRLVIKKTIETSKEIFTKTNIFKKPVSVVSLAYHKLREYNFDLSARIVIVGAGQTNRTMTKFLRKHGYKNLSVFNRTPQRAEDLVKEVGGRAFALSELKNFKEGFDVLISCTAAAESIIDSILYNSLLAGEEDLKVIIDLSVPGDIADEISTSFPVKVINIEELKITANINLKERSKDTTRCEEIIDRSMLEFHDLYKTRQIELAMRHIPAKVREVRETAVNAVFAKDLEKLDANSREVIDKMMAYMEKKYISMPFRMAKEAMLKKK